MADATTRFFGDLDRREHEPLLAKVRGSLRFDLGRGDQVEHWLVSIDRGDVRVSREDRQADCVIRADPELFERLVRGQTNTIAAVLRGSVTLYGDAQLLLRLQRLLPGPPDSLGPRRSLRGGGRP
jgi:putative sterol carrier protein